MSGPWEGLSLLDGEVRRSHGAIQGGARRGDVICCRKKLLDGKPTSYPLS